MANTANITPAAAVDGVPYVLSGLLPAVEGDLGTPFATPYQQAVSAAVELTAQGSPASAASYIVLQTDMGDGVWFDVAWCVWSGTSGGANFFLSAGVAGAGSFQQSRAIGSSPGSNGANQCPLGGRCRFVGKSSITSSSSSSSSGPGTTPGVKATIRFKQLGLR